MKTIKNLLLGAILLFAVDVTIGQDIQQESVEIPKSIKGPDGRDVQAPLHVASTTDQYALIVESTSANWISLNTLSKKRWTIEYSLTNYGLLFRDFKGMSSFRIGRDYNASFEDFIISGNLEVSQNAAINGKLEAKEIKVTTSPTADFVFAEDYSLRDLNEVDAFVKENKHLPEIASAKEMQEEGVNMGEFQIQLLQKIEELTLYVIDQNKKLEAQQEEIGVLKGMIVGVE